MDSGYEEPKYLGYLDGHTDWVTCIKTVPGDEGLPDAVFSSSRDKKLMVWKLDPLSSDSDGPVGHALRAMTGHSECIQDFAVSNNGSYAVTASWDKTMRLWDVELGKSIRIFNDHTSDINSVALSPDNRQIVSGSRDKTVKLWNVKAQCKFTMKDNQHSDWVSCTRFSPLADKTLIVSGGWDKVVKVWNLKDCSLKTNLIGHTGPVYSITISPDGSLCASGGKDGIAMLWDVNEGRHLYSIPAMSPINCLCFSPNHYWLCAATDTSIKIWNLEEDKNVITNLEPPNNSSYDDEGKLVKPKRALGGSGIPWCVSLAWSSDGQILYAGSTDGRIYLYDFGKE